MTAKTSAPIVAYARSQRIETAASLGSWILPAPYGDELGEDRDGDFFGADRADVEADRRVHALQAFGRHPFGEQRVVNALHFRLAADQTEIAEVARGERAQCVEIVRVSARDDDDVRARGRSARWSHSGIVSTMTSSASGNRSLLANFSRSSSTCVRNPIVCARRAEVITDMAGADHI